MNLSELAAVVADEVKAFALVERIRWPDGPYCPHCGGTDRIYVLSGVKEKKGRERIGLKKCGHCRKQFTVRVGSIFEDSPVALGKWPAGDPSDVQQQERDQQRPAKARAWD